MRIITEETKPDDLGPPSGAMVGDPLDPNTWADGAEGGLARADAYEPKHREAYHVEKADSTTSAGDTPSPIELGGKARIVTPLKEAPEHSPPPDSKKEPTKGGEGSHVEYVNVLGSPENIHAMDHQGKAGDEVARELHEKGP